MGDVRGGRRWKRSARCRASRTAASRCATRCGSGTTASGGSSRAWLTESPPDPRPSLEEFTTLREPGEEERNGFDRALRLFPLAVAAAAETACSPVDSRHDDLDLKPGQQARIFIELTPLRRGVIRLDDLRVLLPDPFGLFQRCRKVKAPPATLTVLPRRYPLPPIELPGGAAFKISGEANTNSIGNSGEFVGLRDYRPGDPLRQIHWKSWARTGRPIVKELEDTFYPRYGLIVDTLSCDRTDHQFEEAISVAASFAASIDTSESLLDLMFIKNEAHIVTAGRGVERAEKLLEVLAGVIPGADRRIHQALAQLVLRHRDDLTSCLVILNGWDESRAEFLSHPHPQRRALRAHHHRQWPAPPEMLPATGWNPATSPAISYACRPGSTSNPNIHRAINHVHPPPRLLLGASLLFWGVMTGQAVHRPAARAGGGKRATGRSIRWDFDEEACGRAWQFTTIGIALAAVLIFLDETPYIALPNLLTWLPPLLLPMQFIQSYGLRDSLPLSTFSFLAKHRRQRNLRLGLIEQPIHINFGNVYFVTTLISATLGEQPNSWPYSFVFLPGIVVLTGWRLLVRQSQPSAGTCRGADSRRMHFAGRANRSRRDGGLVREPRTQPLSLQSRTRSPP